MLGIVLQAGFELTQQVDQADFLVINTCGFLKAARQESKSEISLLLNEKKPTSKLIVTGCMVNLHKEEILEDYPEIDHVLGAGSIDKILKVIKKNEATVTTTEQGEHNSSRALSRRSFLEDGEVPRFVATPKHYAYLKIAEGCRKRCSFCIIPKIKGPLRSKPSEQIINECSALLKNGSKEIILIAQDLGDYGKDLKGEMNACLATMLRELLSSIHDADFWLRLMYLYPDEITNDIIDIMQSDKRICRYLDMPIQHINDEILKRMRRKTTGSDIRQTIQKLRSKLPDVHIRTSLMVGFPGETEEQFQELLDFVQHAKLENVGVFQYSNEEMALSSRLDNHVPEDVKQDRYNRLMEAQLAIVCERNRDRIRQTLEQVVIEGIHPENEDWIVGRYFGQCPDIDGQVIIDDISALNGQPVQPGSRYRVELTDYMHYDLMGRIVV
jgi:ribosomal protein S12 methylthiotransferase